MERVFFYFIAVAIIVFAFMAVTNRNMMRSIIYLLFVLIGVSSIYFMIEYNFLGAVQLTVYAGGIIILYINSIMLIEKIGTPMEKVKTVRKVVAGIISVFGLALTLFAIYSYPFQTVKSGNVTTVSQIGQALLGYGNNGYVLPFEVISILLLAAMVGAIMIAKTEKK